MTLSDATVPSDNFEKDFNTEFTEMAYCRHVAPNKSSHNPLMMFFDDTKPHVTSGISVISVLKSLPESNRKTGRPSK
jgi:hypothetical protein